MVYKVLAQTKKHATYLKTNAEMNGYPSKMIKLRKPIKAKAVNGRMSTYRYVVIHSLRRKTR